MYSMLALKYLFECVESSFFDVISQIQIENSN